MLCGRSVHESEFAHALLVRTLIEVHDYCIGGRFARIARVDLHATIVRPFVRRFVETQIGDHTFELVAIVFELAQHRWRDPALLCRYAQSVR
jgi:hypothetical protein